jgi:hypothetical protein
MDYITEKFARLDHWVVPIVLTNRIYKHLVPHNSYIAVDKFANMKALSDYLLYLQHNVTAYREYFRWRQTHKIVNTFYTDKHFGRSGAYCKLCEHLQQTNETISTTRDIVKWYNGEGICQRFSLTLLSRLRQFVISLYFDYLNLPWSILQP